MSDWKPPWLPFYVGDYLADTQHLNTEQHGAYCLLLFAAWNRGGSLPADEEVLRVITRLSTKGWKQHRAVLLEFFTKEDGGGWTQKRLSEEMAKACSTASRRSEAGSRGASRRWQGDGKRDGPANGKGIPNGMASRSQIDGNSHLTSQTSNNKHHTGAARAETGDPERAQWQARLSGYQPGGFWMANNWGPPPDKRGCNAPPDLVEAWQEKHGLKQPKA